MRFDAQAHLYDAHAAPQRAFAGRVAAFLDLVKGTEILEFGAGTGALSAHLVSAGAKVLATDASPRMVALGQTAVPGAVWFQLDAFGDHLPSSALQVSSGLLQWARDPLEVLRRWKTALRPGGHMVHAMPCDPCLQEWRQLVPDSPVIWRDRAGWLALFAQAGLRVRRDAHWVLELSHDSALDMLRALHRSGVTGQPRLSAGQLRRAIATYDAQHPAPRGGVLSTWAWMAVEAENPD
jgi:malonyl-CoA O-methyltransferase